MIVLADNDIVHKLACCDLLTELTTLLDVQTQRIWVLASMPFVVRNKLQKNYPAAIKTLDAFLRHSETIPAASPLLLQQLSHPGIDPGEAQMIAVLIETPSVVRFVTGDKRALNALSRLAASNAQLAKRLLDTRTDCLESTMLALIEKFGYKAINTKVSAAIEAHCFSKTEVLQIAFGKNKSAASANEALLSYLDNLKRDAPFVAKHIDP